jgi:hypothetical protein
MTLDLTIEALGIREASQGDAELAAHRLRKP